MTKNTITLSAFHREELRAIDPDVIAERGYCTVDRPLHSGGHVQQIPGVPPSFGTTTREILNRMGFPSWATKEDYFYPGLWIPGYSPRGDRYAGQWKPKNPVPNRDGKKMKYASAKGTSVRLDVHPRWSKDAGGMELPPILDVTKRLWITEGVKKADALTSRGEITVALSGVFNWRNSHGGIGDWEDVRLRDREVVICFDSDAIVKAPVAQAMERLGKWLKYKGVKRIVYCVVPPAIGDESVKGVDDYFLAGGSIKALEQSAFSTRPPHVVDSNNAFTDARLVDTLSGDLLGGAFVWNKSLGWLAWNGDKWADTSDQSVVNAVRRYVLEQHADAAMGLKEGKPGAGELVEGWHSMLSASRLKAVTALSAGEREVPDDSFDAELDCINTPDGYLNLNTGELRPVDEGEYPTKVTGARFDMTAQSDLWDSFLERILPDVEVREFVQRLFGYALLGEVREHIMPIFTGEGANGKGTLRDALLKAFGDYAVEVDPELLMQSHNPRHLTFLMELRGRRLVFCSETEKRRRFAEATMKRLVGGDPIQANRMKKDPITFDPSHTLIMPTNHLPQVSGDDPAVWRRILVVPFDVVIPPEERDPRLPKRLQEPDVQRAVLAWAFKGYWEYVADGLRPPASVRARTTEYQSDHDHMGRFLEERVERSGASRTTAKALHTAYAEWMKSEFPKEPILSTRDLGKDLRRRGWEPVKSGGVMIYRGMHLIQDQDGESSPHS